MQLGNIDGRDPEQLVSQGMAAIQKRDFRLAVSVFDSVLQEVPDQIGALTGAATAHWNLGDMIKTIDLLERAHALQPDNNQIRMDLHQVLLTQYGAAQQSGDSHTSVSAMRKLIALDPDCTPAQINLGKRAD